MSDPGDTSLNDVLPVNPLRVLIVDDHGIVRDGLRMLISNWPHLAVVGDAGTGLAALAMAAQLKPDVILLDIYLAGEDSLTYLPQMLEASPESRVLILTAVEDPEVHRRAVLLGARGIVLKGEVSSVLIRAIERVSAGEVWLNPQMVAGLLGELSRSRAAVPVDPIVAKIATLTDREREIVAAVSKGLSNKQIAKRLSISESTVNHHIGTIFTKLEVFTRLELAVFAFESGLATVSS